MSIAPPRPLRAPVPRLDTVHEVEAIMRAAHANDEDPLPLAEIKRRMKARSVRHATVRACVEELKRLGLVMEGSKGVMWTLHEDPAFWAEPTVELWPNPGRRHGGLEKKVTRTFKPRSRTPSRREGAGRNRRARR